MTIECYLDNCTLHSKYAIAVLEKEMTHENYTE